MAELFLSLLLVLYSITSNIEFFKDKIGLVLGIILVLKKVLED